MMGNKYAIALTQITSSLQGSKDALYMAQRLVKFMGNGLHRYIHIIGMIIAKLVSSHGAQGITKVMGY
jgi:hypothetical protein